MTWGPNDTRTHRKCCYGAIPLLEPMQIESLRAEFSGCLQQVPPMYSALKKDGSRLYQLARKGMEVGREARPVRVELNRLQQVGPAELEFELTCSKGTYVRTLAADIGRSLGCGAHLSRLRRVASGPFRIADAVALDELGHLEDVDAVPLVSLNDALGHLGCAVLGVEPVERLRRGLQDSLAAIEGPAAAETTRRVVDPAGDLVALIGWEKAAAEWRILRVFKSSR